MAEKPTRPLSDITVHCIGNAHIDAAWLWRWDETVRVVRETFESALDRMEETPEFVFTCSQSVYFRWMEEQYPELFARIRERVAEGRWDLAGGWWVQPDCNIPSGESLVRQALYGQRYLASRFDQVATVGYNPDTFGHCNVIPQILAKSGMDAYLFFRPGPHEKTLEGETFWWEAPDGSRVLASRPPHHYCTGEEDLAERLRTAAEQAPPQLADVMCFYGVGDHGGGPTKRAIASMVASTGTPGGPKARFACIEDFYREARRDEAPLPVLRDDLQHHAPGCYSVHSEVKRRNRECEQLLSAAESMATLAWAAGGPDYPDAEITQAWAALLFNQFHDILAGTSIPEVYEDANEMYDEAEGLAQDALEPALTSLAARADTRGEGLPLVVFNPLSWAHEVPVEVEIPWDYRLDLVSVWGPDGRQVPVQIDRIQGSAAGGMLRIVFLAKVGPLGHAVYHCRPAQPEAFPAVGAVGCEMENELLRVAVDGQSGRLASVFDKANGVEVLSQPAADFLVLTDRSDTWSHGVPAFRDVVGRFSGAQVSVAEAGPVRAVLRIESAYGQSSLRQDLILWKGSGLVEGRVQLDWHEQHAMVKLAFPLHLDQATVTYETPYATIERAANGDEEPGQQWVDVSGVAAGTSRPYGVALLNTCKYGFDVLGTEARISVLRSPVYAFHEPREIDPNETYRYIDQGLQSFTWALLPHLGSWGENRVVEHARELNAVPLVYLDTPHEGEWPAEGANVSVEPESVHVTALKRAEDGDGVIVRLVETRGEAASACLGLGFLGKTWEGPVGAYEIKTLRFPEPGDDADVVETDLLERPVS